MIFISQTFDNNENEYKYFNKYILIFFRKKLINLLDYLIIILYI